MNSFQTMGLEVARLAVWLALLAAIFVPLERCFGVRAAKARRAELFTDVGHFFVNGLLLGMLLAAPLALALMHVRQWLPAAWLETVQAWPLALKFIVAVLVSEAGFYWGHRLSHRWPWLWRFHAVHHSAEHLDFLVGSRGHPFDILFTRLMGLIPLHLLGLAGPSLAGTGLVTALALVGMVWGFFLHANLRWRLGPLEWLVATPAFHHWHHARGEVTNRNFAPLLPVMDQIFGTWHRSDHWPKDYGIHEQMPPDLFGQWLGPVTAPAPADSQLQR